MAALCELEENYRVDFGAGYYTRTCAIFNINIIIIYMFLNDTCTTVMKGTKVQTLGAVL